MAAPKGSIQKRSHDSLTIIAPGKRDPETGRYRQTWQTVKRHPGESDKQLRDRAERELRRLLTRLDEGEPVARGRITVADYITGEWLPAVALNVSTRTAGGYESIMREHILPVIGTRRLRDLQPSDIERVYRRMAERGKSGNTRLHAHRVLSMALKAALRKGLVTRNVCSFVDAPRKEPFTIEPPTPEEVGKLMAAADKTRIGVLVRVLAFTGMRLGEALGLRWKDVDLDHAVINIRQTRKERDREEFGTPKTERSRRSVDLAPELVDSLREHKRRQLAFYLENGLFDRQDLLFTTLDKNGVTGLTHNAVANIWKRVRVTAGVPRARIHDLRHFAATQMVSAGVSLVDVAAILGHSRPSTTSDIYSHYVKGRGRAAVAEIAKVLAGK
jgi:integrase